jgi:hypothetical protein
MTKKQPPTPIVPAANLTAHAGKAVVKDGQQQHEQQHQQQHCQQQPDYAWQLGMQQVWEGHCLSHGHGLPQISAAALYACGNKVASFPSLPNIQGMHMVDCTCMVGLLFCLIIWNHNRKLLTPLL